MGENVIYRVNVKSMTLENYIKLYNEVFYPKNYPYHLRVGLKGESNRVSMILQIGEPVETIKLYSDEFDIDEPTLYKFHDVLTVFGDTDEEVINAFNRIELSDNIKEAFQKIWDK